MSWFLSKYVHNKKLRNHAEMQNTEYVLKENEIWQNINKSKKTYFQFQNDCEVQGFWNGSSSLFSDFTI